MKMLTFGKRLVGSALCIALAACTLNQGPPNVPQPVTAGQQPGTIAAVAVEDYNNAPLGNGYVWGSLPNMIASQNQILSNLNSSGWQTVLSSQNSSVRSYSFGTSTQNNADMFAMFGHGAPGIVAFDDGSVWGVGSDSGQYPQSMGSGTMPRNTSGMPISGRLHWMFLWTSDSVAGPTFTDINTNWTANWRTAFGTGSGRTLHGIYGFWQHPHVYCGGDYRACDLNASQDQPMADRFSRLAYGPGANTVHDAFVYAANDASVEAGDEWSIWEDQNSRKDALSSGNVNTGTSGNLVFYNVENTNGVFTSQVAVGNETFSLTPYNLVPEAINDASGLSQIQQNYDSNTQYSDNGAVRAASNAAYAVEHFYATTGAVIARSAMTDTTLGFDNATALQAATDYVNQTLGMPGDAVLSQNLTLWKDGVDSGSSVVVGYEFIWRHADGVDGGDGIKVIVNDRITTLRTCTEPNENDPPYNKPICLAWQTTVQHNPTAVYAYRLWRGLAGMKRTASSGAPAGSPSIDAYTASLSLPSGFTVTGYHAGYWTGSAIDPSGGAAGAVPAWIFENGDSSAAVDAATGAYLGPA